MSAAGNDAAPPAVCAPPAQAAVASGNAPSEGAIGNNSDNPRRRPPNTDRRTANTTNTFKGETSKLNGNVFQVHSEQKDESQFIETIEVLRVYASSSYKSDIEALTTLFTKLETPEVKEPEDPIETEIIVDKKTVKIISKFEEMKYSENMKP